MQYLCMLAILGNVVNGMEDNKTVFKGTVYLFNVGQRSLQVDLDSISLEHAKNDIYA